MMRYAPGGLTADERPCVQLSEMFVFRAGNVWRFLLVVSHRWCIQNSDDELD
jgi:hypothetical protein